jgi:hypothetical protein
MNRHPLLAGSLGLSLLGALALAYAAGPSWDRFAAVDDGVAAQLWGGSGCVPVSVSSNLTGCGGTAKTICSCQIMTVCPRQQFYYADPGGTSSNLKTPYFQTVYDCYECGVPCGSRQITVPCI